MTDTNESTAVAVTDSKAELTLADMWSSMMDMARDPSVDAAKIGHLVTLQEQMVDRAAKDRWTRAFAQACRDMPEITKDGKIEHNGKFIGWFKRYEDLRAIVDKIIQPLGLTVRHDSAEIDGGKAGVTIWTVITYMDETYTWSEIRGRMPVPPDTGGAKNAAQALGSSSTYGQRYSLTAAFGIVQRGLDTDGRSQPKAQLSGDEEHDRLVDAGRRAAKEGPAGYAAWLKGLTNVQKGWLITHGHHDTLSKAARDIAGQGV